MRKESSFDFNKSELFSGLKFSGNFLSGEVDNK